MENRERIMQAIKEGKVKHTSSNCEEIKEYLYQLDLSQARMKVKLDTEGRKYKG